MSKINGIEERGRRRISLQFAWLIVGLRQAHVMASIHNFPELGIVASRFLNVGLIFRLWLWHTMFSHQMCLKVVLSVACVGAIFDVAIPALNMTVLLILVADVVSLPLERPGIFATCPSAGKRCNILCGFISIAVYVWNYINVP